MNYWQMHSLNFGVGGDRTENVLWRLQNGELEGLAPKVSLMYDISTLNCRFSCRMLREICVGNTLSKNFHPYFDLFVGRGSDGWHQQPRRLCRRHRRGHQGHLHSDTGQAAAGVPRRPGA